jgi:Raf kinase inhibitor-like YbhB/YbcL family protein
MITVTSPDFVDGATIPRPYTCDGQGISPDLRWSGVPADSVALALVVEDPDAPNGTFTHWVVVDIDPAVTALAAGAPPPGARQLPNSSGRAIYSPACPPAGSTHHYRFTLYALAQRLAAAAAQPVSDVRVAIEAAATARGTLVGSYRREG